MRDLIITWPKDRPLDSYIRSCDMAARQRQVINYHIARPPVQEVRPRVYVVYDGFVRGWQRLLSIEERGKQQVRHHDGGFWPAGWYIVRSPVFHPLDPLIPMRSFQGWRYFTRP